MDAQVNGSALARLNDFVVELLLHLIHHLLDTCRMYASVGNQLMECQTACLTAHRVEATDDDGLWCVIDDDFNAASCL